MRRAANAYAYTLRLAKRSRCKQLTVLPLNLIQIVYEAIFFIHFEGERSTRILSVGHHHNNVRLIEVVKRNHHNQY